MKHRFQWITGAVALLAFAGPLAAQDPAENAPPAVQDPTMEAPQDPAAMEQPAAEQAAHDWEFALAPTEKAPGASATVMVSDAETGSDFTIVVTGLPAVDELDAENQDVSTYTVWIVPGKDKVNESQLAGVLEVSPDGEGRLEAETELESFGVIVAASADASPTQINGVPVLTGIPVQADAAPDVAEEAAEAAENVAEEAAELNAADPEDKAEEAADVQEEVQEGMEEVAEEQAEEAAEAPAGEPAPEATPDAAPQPQTP